MPILYFKNIFVQIFIFLPANRTWPSREVVAIKVSPLWGKNLDWNTFEVWPDLNDNSFLAFCQSHTIISRSSEPDASLLPVSLKCLKSNGKITYNHEEQVCSCVQSYKHISSHI